MAASWTCPHCCAEQTHETWCESCHVARYATFAVQLAHHILEHLSDGLSDPVEVLEALCARPCYERYKRNFTLGQIAGQMRLLTKDTTTLARQLVKARSARTMLEVLETGDTKDKIAVLAKWGPETNAEHVEVKGETIERLVIENHDGPPPKKEQP